MQSQGRNVSTRFKGRFWFQLLLEPDRLQGFATRLQGYQVRTTVGHRGQNDTMCRSVSTQKTAVCQGRTREGNGLWLRGVYGGGVDQHDRDVVLDWINAAAFPTLQTAAVAVKNYRLLANGANEHIEKILRNHGVFIVARTFVYPAAHKQRMR
jgi:hypothetical protein